MYRGSLTTLAGGSGEGLIAAIAMKAWPDRPSSAGRRQEKAN